MIAGDHDDADAGPLRRGDGVPRLGAQRVDQRRQPEQTQPGELLLGGGGDRPGGDRDHAISGGGEPLGRFRSVVEAHRRRTRKSFRASL